MRSGGRTVAGWLLGALAMAACTALSGFDKLLFDVPAGAGGAAAASQASSNVNVSSGSGGMGAGGTSTTATSTPQSSSAGGGQPTCPGEAVQCVNDWLTADKGLSNITDIVGSPQYLYIAAGSAIYRAAFQANPTLELIAGSSQSGYADGPGAIARFTSLAGLATDGLGTLWAADAGSFTIRSIDLANAGFKVSTLAGNATESAHTDGSGGPGGTARLKKPTALALDDPQGPHVLLYLIDGNWIRTVNGSGGAVASLAGQDAAGAQDNAVGSMASFNGPVELFATTSTVYIADQGNYRIRAMATAAPYGVANFCGSVKALSDGKCLNNGYMMGPAGLVGTPGGMALTDVDSTTNAVRTIVNGALATIAGQKKNVHVVGIGNEAGIPKPGALYYRSFNGDASHELYIVENGTQIRRMVLP